jgi:hypothetical protein
VNRGCYAKNPNSIRQRIENLLLEHGGMTISDLIEEIPGHTKGGISKIVCDMRDAGTIYIKEWEMTQPGQKRHPRPVWDHAQNSDVQPPRSKRRPMPVGNATRLKLRRQGRSRGSAVVACLFKLVKTAHEEVLE